MLNLEVSHEPRRAVVVDMNRILPELIPRNTAGRLRKEHATNHLAEVPGSTHGATDWWQLQGIRSRAVILRESLVMALGCNRWTQQFRDTGCPRHAA